MDGVDPEIPFERQVLERIATGLSDLRFAIATDDIEPIVRNYHLGFSANMCRALDEIYVKVEGRRIEYDFIWSSEVASEVATAWKPFTFEGKAYEILSEAARKLEKIEIRVPLTPVQYQLACDAHKDGKRIKILGIPEKSAKYWTLTKPHGFEVLRRAGSLEPLRGRTVVDLRYEGRKRAQPLASRHIAAGSKRALRASSFQNGFG
jgi:hypothetical protein